MQKSAITRACWTVVGICATATAYPYVLYPAILRVLPPRPVQCSGSPSDGGREFALLFCAYNEARAMPNKMENLRALRARYPHLEILAYDDSSSDGTAEIIKNAGLGIRLVRGAGRTGKAHGMKLMASMTDRELLVFTDANVELAPDALDHLRRSYADPTVGGVCGHLFYVDSENTAAADAGGLYWRLEEMIKSLESRSGNVMGADGSIFSIRKSLYPEFPDTVLDDMTVSMEVVFQNHRLVKNPEVVARERLVASAKDDYGRRLRIATRVFHTHMVAIRPRLKSLPLADRWRWWSHRYVKWHGAFFLTTGYAGALAGIGLTAGRSAAAATGSSTAVVLLAATYLKLGPLSAVAHMLSSIFLSGLGVLRARRGHTVTTWKPPETR